MQRNRQERNRRGLTLIEMVVVLSILTLMVGLVVPLIDNFRQYDGVRQQKKQLEELNEAAMAWARDYVLKYGEDGFHLGCVLPGLSFSPSTVPGSPTGCNGSDGLESAEFAIVPSEVLENNAGPSYLTHWFEDQIDTSTADLGLKDTWGKALEFEQSNPLGLMRVIKSKGPNGTEESVHSDDVVFEMNFEPVLLQDRQYRVKVINSMLGQYNKKARPPFESYDLDDDLTMLQELIMTMQNPANPFINNDPYWEQEIGMLEVENFLTVRSVD